MQLQSNFLEAYKKGEHDLTILSLSLSLPYSLTNYTITFSTIKSVDSHAVLPSNMHKYVTHYIKDVANAVSSLG